MAAQVPAVFDRQDRIIRRPRVEDRTGHPRSTLYEKIRAGMFPAPVAIGARSVGWIEAEIEEIIAARIAGKTDDEIRALVERLHAARKAAV